MSVKFDLFSENVIENKTKVDEITIDESVVDATELAKNNYTDYSKYVAQGRSYPQIYDGAKSSYRRAIYGMYKGQSQKKMKVAELAALALPYHPHPTSVSGVIVQLGEAGNKLKLMDTQGNWGDSTRGVEASADRYIEGRLSTLAEHLLCDSVEYAEMVPGEIDKPEPKALPALLPLCFINGSSGIPSGLPTLNVPTLDINSMIDYYIDVLSHKDLDYRPKKFPNPNLEIDILSNKEDWNNIMRTGKGSIRTAPRMEIDSNNVITITSLPKTKNGEHIRRIIKKEILLDKVDLRDESAKEIRFVVEKVPHKQCDMKEIFKRLYSKLQSSETYNMAFFDENKIYVPCSFHKVVKSNLQFLIETHQNRIKIQLEQLKVKLKVIEIIEDMKKKNKFKELFDLDSKEALEYIRNTYKVDNDISAKVLQKPLSYLTREHKQEIIDLKNDIKSLENDQDDIYEFLIGKYKNIKKELNQVIKNKFKPTTFVKAQEA